MLFSLLFTAMKSWRLHCFSNYCLVFALILVLLNREEIFMFWLWEIQALLRVSYLGIWRIFLLTFSMLLALWLQRQDFQFLFLTHNKESLLSYLEQLYLHILEFFVLMNCVRWIKMTLAFLMKSWSSNRPLSRKLVLGINFQLLVLFLQQWMLILER